MTLYLYATKNKKSGNFGKPSGEIYEPEQAKAFYNISVKETPKEQAKLMCELELYYLGTLDTETGIITNKVEFLMDLGACYEQGTSSEVE